MKRYIKDGKIYYQNRIVIRKDGKSVYNPTEEMILADGWVEYVPPVVEPQPYRKSMNEVMQEIVVEYYNSKTDITDEEALDKSIAIYNWDKYIGKTLQVGQVCVYNDKVYRIRQDHTVQDIYPPSLDTASLYEVIELLPTGEKDDPIPYTPPMEIFSDKYYTQDNTLYLCIRNSETALSHNLSDLINLYVEQI